jgi:hypothetical protein
MTEDSKDAGQKDYTWLRWLITIIAIVVALIRIIFPKLEIDAVSLGLIILALAPWLSPIVKSIEIVGVGKIELQELKDKVQQLEGAVSSANQKADLANASSSRHEAAFRQSINPVDELSELANKYTETREKLKASNARTALMTQLFGEMVEKSMQINAMTVEEWLRDTNPGKRLAAIAFLYAKPAPEILETMIDSVSTEVKGFNQYWGIQTIRKIIGQIYPSPISDEIAGKLRNLSRQLPPNTDRYYEMQNILQSFDNLK